MKLLILILLFAGTGLVKGVTVKNYRSLNMSQSVPVPRVEGMVNCTIIGVARQVITLRCSNGLYMERSKRKWPAEWERVFKLEWNYAAMYEKGKLRPVKSPPLHVNGGCGVFRQKGEEPFTRSNCIATP